jgi:nucleotide-binding universal stress UspA family protein
MTISRILVPVEYSDHCRAALEYAGSLAERLGAAIEVVHVWERPSFVPDNLVVAEPGQAARSLIEMIREGAEREMDAFLARAKLPATVRVEHRLCSGEPTHAILDFVAKQHPDLIVMSTHGRTALRHLLMGSVTERILRLSSVPVLIVPVRAVVGTS